AAGRGGGGRGLPHRAGLLERARAAPRILAQLADRLRLGGRGHTDEPVPACCRRGATMNDRPSDQDIVLLSGARTPFGDFGGALRDLDAVELGVRAARGALERGGIGPDQVDHVVMGNMIQTSGADSYLARHVGLKSGCAIGVPALTVNRLCGSGLQALVTAAQLIKLGEAEVVLAGGTESMSQQPHLIRGARWGLRFRQGQLEDNLWLGLTDAYNNLPMAMTAENLALRHGISRKEADDFAYVSHMRASSAERRGYFADQLVPVTAPGRRTTA